jgi:hypothetical protein
VKWLLAAGLAAAVAAIAYAWYRGGEETTIGEPLVIGARRHHVIPAARDGAPLLVLLHQ